MTVPRSNDPADPRAVLARRHGLRWGEGPPDERFGPLGDEAANAIPPDERHALLPAITVGETCFFRYADQLAVFASLLRRMPAPGRPLRILSAGCSTGEEAYTVAMIAREVLPAEAADRVRVVGIDLNPVAVARARAGRYSAWSLRDAPPASRERWVPRTGGVHVVHPVIREMVRFEERSLVDEDPLFWQADAWDVILCRNVLMYLTPAAVRLVVGRFAHALVEGGPLFLGHAEVLRPPLGGFVLELRERASWYRRCSQADTVRPAAGADFPDSSAELRAEPTTDSTPVPRASPAAPPEDDGDAAIADAVAHLAGGGYGEAERLAREVLRRGEHAGAHYLLALLSDRAGERARCAAHHHAALLVDPSFAMPRLHLALQARRAGNRAAARRGLKQALALLQHEDERRIRLYGGGFEREALLKLCRAELDACAGP